MATVNAQLLSKTGLNATYNTASAGGDKVKADRHTFLHVKNASGGSLTVTLTTPATYGGLAVTDPVTTIPNNEDRFIGPLNRELFGNPADSWLCAIGWSTETSVTFAALKTA